MCLLFSLVTGEPPWGQVPLTASPPFPVLGETAAPSCLQPVVRDGVYAPGTSCFTWVDPPSVKPLVSLADCRVVSLVLMLGKRRACVPAGCAPARPLLLPFKSRASSLVSLWGPLGSDSCLPFWQDPSLPVCLLTSVNMTSFYASWMHHSHFFLWIIAPSFWNAFSLETNLENMFKCPRSAEIETFHDDLIKSNYPLDPVSLAVFIFLYSMNMPLHCKFCHLCDSVYLFCWKFHEGGDFILTMHDFSVPSVWEHNLPPQNMSVLRII